MCKYYSVRLKSLVSISEKAFLAEDFNGNKDIIPKSQVAGQDYNVTKSEAYWISEWILTKKTLTYGKNWTYFSKSGKNIGRIEIKHHVPKHKEPKQSNEISGLRKSKES